MTSHRILAPAGLVLLLVLSGCSLPTAGGAGGGGTPDSATDTGTDSAATGSAIDTAVADGMPTLPLAECETLIDYTSEHLDSSSKWVFKYSCADASAYEQTVAAVADLEGSDHISDRSDGSDGYLSDQDLFYVQLADQDELDVSLAITGFEGDYEAKYTIVFREN
jgi:hypothetical protein